MIGVGEEGKAGMPTSIDEDDGGVEHGGAGSSMSGCLSRRRRWQCGLLGVGVVGDEVVGGRRRL